MATTLSQERLRAVLARIPPVPGEVAPRPRPAHVLYGGAHLFRADSPEKLGRLARAAMDRFAPDGATFGAALGIDDAALAATVHARVQEKLATTAVESMTIDFEDGYGIRSDDEEDRDAVRTGAELGRRGVSSTQVGLRIRALGGRTAERGARTLDLFFTSFAAEAKSWPRTVAVTLPKVTSRAEVEALSALADALEEALGLEPQTITLELMIEHPRALIDPEGRVVVQDLCDGGRGRVAAVHLGAYDLTASLGVTARDQALDHHHCDMARALMQLALSGTDVAVVDGATTTLPLATFDPKAAAPDPRDVTLVHRAWRLHADNVRRALHDGIYEGWDLHPAQLPARYGALFRFFLEGASESGARLAQFVERASQATRSGQTFDDAATGQGLLNFFARGLACGALDASDLARTGLSRDEVSGRSFERIVLTRGVGRP